MVTNGVAKRERSGPGFHVVLFPPDSKAFKSSGSTSSLQIIKQTSVTHILLANHSETTRKYLLPQVMNGYGSGVCGMQDSHHIFSDRT